MEKFNPDKEGFTYTPIWVRLYFLRKEYRYKEIMVAIGNILGTHVKSVEPTKQGCYTAYARICIYMHVSVPILDSICLIY